MPPEIGRFMPLRVALLGFYHETNTFSASRTDFASFEAYQFAEGIEILSRYSGSPLLFGILSRQRSYQFLGSQPALRFGHAPRYRIRCGA